MSSESAVHKGSCYCGAVQVTVQGPPAAAAYCHCLECRKWHSAPINAFSIWPKANVTINGPTTTSTVSEGCGGVSCGTCGGCFAYLKPTLVLTVIYPMTLAGPDGTFEFEPAFHIFYEERVMNVNDGLPKFVDLPEPLGGSGKTVEESGSPGWR